MSNQINYRGYKANVEYDNEDEIYVGHVLGIKDVLSFHGKSLDELEISMHNCIDNYLNTCKSVGKEPEFVS